MHGGRRIGDTARQRFRTEGSTTASRRTGRHRRPRTSGSPRRSLRPLPTFRPLCALSRLTMARPRTPAVGISLRRRALARRSGRQEARVLMGLKSGAQRASIPRGVVRGLVAAVLATFIVAPSVVGASSAGTAAATTVTIPYASPTWLSTEQWYLGLVNCTRTGGWVLPDGSCRGYGTGRYSAYVRPLTRGAGISGHVSRPYARLLAVRNICKHWSDGDPRGRLRPAGYLRQS